MTEPAISADDAPDEVPATETEATSAESTAAENETPAAEPVTAAETTDVESLEDKLTRLTATLAQHTAHRDRWKQRAEDWAAQVAESEARIAGEEAATASKIAALEAQTQAARTELSDLRLMNEHRVPPDLLPFLTGPHEVRVRTAREVMGALRRRPQADSTQGGTGSPVRTSQADKGREEAQRRIAQRAASPNVKINND